MSAPRNRVAIAAGALALLAAVTVGQESSKPSLKPVYPTAFPAGEGNGIAQRACLTCHTAMLVTQQHKDSTGWEKTVGQMETWGARVEPDSHLVLVRYLAAKQGPLARK